mgnify:FL=1
MGNANAVFKIDDILLNMRTGKVALFKRYCEEGMIVQHINIEHINDPEPYLGKANVFWRPDNVEKIVESGRAYDQIQKLIKARRQA